MTSARTTERWQLVTLAMVTTVTAVVSSLGAPLVPAIARAYGLALTDAQWALTATMLVGAVSTPIIGRFASGGLRRPTIITGLVVVAAGTALAALPLGFATFVAGRALQGVGLALVPLAIAVARDVIPAERLSRAVALLSVTTVAGAGLGYPLTALVADRWGLPGAYGLGTILTLITLTMAVTLVPGSTGVRAPGVDWPGALLLSGAMTVTLLALTRGSTWGPPITVGLALVGAALLATWVAWTLASPAPLVDLRLATHPALIGPNLTALMAGVGMYGLLTLVIVLVQDDTWGLHQPVTVAGLMLVPYAVTSVAGSRVARLVAHRFGTAPLLPTGCLLFFAASATLALAHDHLWQAAACMAVGGLGSGLTFSSLAVIMVPHVPRAETASAMAFNQVLRYLGFAVGSSLSVTLLRGFGGGSSGFRASLLVLSSTSVLAAAATFTIDRRLSAGSDHDRRILDQTPPSP